MLYVGDGLKNDTFPARQIARWGALLILEGMEVEGYEQPDAQSQMKNQRYKVVFMRVYVWVLTCVCVCVCVWA